MAKYFRSTLTNRQQKNLSFVFRCAFFSLDAVSFWPSSTAVTDAMPLLLLLPFAAFGYLWISIVARYFRLIQCSCGNCISLLFVSSFDAAIAAIQFFLCVYCCSLLLSSLRYLSFDWFAFTVRYHNALSGKHSTFIDCAFSSFAFTSITQIDGRKAHGQTVIAPAITCNVVKDKDKHLRSSGILNGTLEPRHWPLCLHSSNSHVDNDHWHLNTMSE